jgi:hypothetical protein
MLILSFPEISWYFGVSAGPRDEYESINKDPKNTVLFPDFSHSLSDLLSRTQRDPLLDPTGLRQWVRRKTAKALLGSDVRPPVRVLRAAAIDDERDYARYHGYTAYRFGCRVDAITKWYLMQKQFSSTDNKPHGYWLLLEDMSLNFSDRPNNIHLLRFRKRESEDKEKNRADHCPKLDSSSPHVETSTHRIVITTGQAESGSKVYKDNVKYLDEKKPGNGSIIFKPAGGMFDLWERARLLKKPKKSPRHGNVAGFEWPLPPPPPDVNSARRRVMDLLANCS